jgi:hypothetical protein
MTDSSKLELVMATNWRSTVWRNMRVVELLEVLQTESLFFRRLDKLRSDDPYEGVMPGTLKRLLAEREKAIFSGLPTSSELDQHTECACVNCWHMKEEESAAMWKLYSQDSGVAIQSNVGTLMNLFMGKRVTMALVEYIDFEALDLPVLPYPVYYKRKSFDHEKELRLVVLDSDTKSSPEGISLSVDLTKLLRRVYVSPEAEPWIVPVIQRELERYGFASSVTVIHSDLRTPQKSLT